MLLRNVLSLSATLMRSRKMFTNVSVLFGRQHSRYQLMTWGLTISTSWRILWKLVSEIPTSDRISYTNFLLSLLTIFHTRSTLGSFLGIDLRLIRVSLSTPSRPYWKRLFHSYTWDILLLYHHTRIATCLISPLMISAAKHKIWYSYVIQLQTFSTAMRPFAHYWYKQLFLCL
jgi:hypothetical protein